VSAEAIEIALDVGTTAARRYGARGELTLVLAHGAGAGQAHPFMVRWASALADRGVEVVTFDFPYMNGKRRAPDRMPVLVSAYAAVAAWARARGPGRLAIGGKSMGGRVASMLAAEHADAADALVFLGYPLHPPGEPDKLRAAHLPKIAAPMLFVQGERDPFGGPDELRPILATLPRATLLPVPGGDHSLAVPKKLRAQAEVDAALQDAIVAFLRR